MSRIESQEVGNAPPPLDVGSCTPKVWWIHSDVVKVDWHYLHALVEVSKVKHLLMHHLKSTAYYKSVFEEAKNTHLKCDDEIGDLLDAMPKRKRSQTSGKPCDTKDKAATGKRQKKDHPRNYRWGAGYSTFKEPNT